MPLDSNATAYYKSFYDHATCISEDQDAMTETYARLTKSLTKAIPITAFIVGIIANALLILYLLKSGRFKSPLFMLITSLALTDFGTCVGVVLYTIFLFPTMEKSTPVIVCPFSGYITTAFYLTSVYHLVLFACLRYAQLVHPLWSRAHITWQAVLKACLVTWVSWSMIQSYFAVFLRAVDFIATNSTETERICVLTGDMMIQEPVSSVYAFIFPSVIIVVIHIAKEIRLKNMIKKSGTEHDDRRLSSDPRALTIVVILYYVTWIPNSIHNSVHLYYDAAYLVSHNFLYHGLRLLTYFNSVLDPFIYCFASKTVRRDIHGYFCERRRPHAGLSKK